MKYSIKDYKDGIVFIEIDNGSKIKATLCNFGAGVFSLKFDNKPIILEFENKDEWLYCDAFYGKTLGRVAGRIPCNGSIDGNTYKLKEEKASYCLHGGTMTSISFVPWKYEVKEYKNKLDVIFSLRDGAKNNGFSGVAKMKVIYEIYTKNDNFKIIYKASTPNATLINLSNHNYYNFFSSQDVSDYTLKINASQYGVIDETTFITGTDKVPWFLDFNRATKLNSRLDYLEKKTWLKTIDNTFIFNEIESKKPQVILKNNDLKLSLFTDYPCLNIFCDNFNKPIKFIQFNEKDSGRRALALEPQLYNRNLDSLVLRKGEKYSHFILLKLKDLRK